MLLLFVVAMTANEYSSIFALQALFWVFVWVVANFGGSNAD